MADETKYVKQFKVASAEAPTGENVLIQAEVDNKQRNIADELDKIVNAIELTGENGIDISDDGTIKIEDDLYNDISNPKTIAPGTHISITTEADTVTIDTKDVLATPTTSAWSESDIYGIKKDGTWSKFSGGGGGISEVIHDDTLSGTGASADSKLGVNYTELDKQYLPLSGGTLTGVDHHDILMIERKDNDGGILGVSDYGTNGSGYPVIKSKKSNYQLDLGNGDGNDIKWGINGSQKSVARVDSDKQSIIYGNDNANEIPVTQCKTTYAVAATETTDADAGYTPQMIFVVKSSGDISSYTDQVPTNSGALFFVLQEV